MSMNVYTGRKFNANHQLAILLSRHLGLDGARRVCNGMSHTQPADSAVDVV